MTYRLGIFACNPVPYKASLYRHLAQHPGFDLKVLYGSTCGVEESDLGFGTNQQWNLPLLKGYPYSVLRNMSPTKTSGFTMTVNPGLFRRVDGEFDGLLIHEGYLRLSSIFALIAANWKGVPVLLHGPGIKRNVESLSKRFVKSAYIKSFLRGVDAVMADCTANCRYYKKYGFPSDRIFTMRVAVDNKRFRKVRNRLTTEDVNDVYSELDIPPDNKIVLFVGRLTKRKRPFNLLKSFDKLGGDMDATLLYVGDGLLRSDLEQRCKNENIDNVVFAGFRNQDELPKFYEAADIFVIPSAYDPSPKVLNEAMNFSLPIVASDGVGSAYDLVKGNGFVYECCNINELADALRYLLTNANERKQMGQQSIAIVDKWNYEQNTNALLRALEAVQRNG